MAFRFLWTSFTVLWRKILACFSAYSKNLKRFIIPIYRFFDFDVWHFQYWCTFEMHHSNSFTVNIIQSYEMKYINYGFLVRKRRICQQDHIWEQLVSWKEYVSIKTTYLHGIILLIRSADSNNVKKIFLRAMTIITELSNECQEIQWSKW